MKTILLMRHAEAGEATQGLTDFDRCLTVEGTEIAQKTGGLLAQLRITIDRVICSSAVRTHETARLVASVVCAAAPVATRDQLYNASGDSFAEAIAQDMFDDESSVLIVGHNPGIASLMCQWAEKRLSVPPATLTIFQFAKSDWSECIRRQLSKPKLTCVIHDGEVWWREPSSETPIETED